jgi:hypothetical protein
MAKSVSLHLLFCFFAGADTSEFEVMETSDGVMESDVVEGAGKSADVVG